MSNPILKLSQLSVNLDGKAILEDISFSVQEGEFLLIIGANGAGKSTLLKTILRIVPFQQGSIELFGQPFTSYSLKELARLVSYVPQWEEGPIPFTVQELVMMGRYPHGGRWMWPSLEDWNYVHAALTLTDTVPFAHRLVTTLSGGERRKVFIAVALAQNAKIMLLDEPTTFLDPKHEIEIQSLLYKLNREQKITMIMVSHQINHALWMAHRVLALKKGRCIFSGTVQESTNPDLLELVYDQPFCQLTDPETGRHWLIPRMKI